MGSFNKVLSASAIPVAIVEDLPVPVEVQYYVDNGGAAGASFWLSFMSPISKGDRRLYPATQPVTEKWAAGTRAYVSWDGANPSSQTITFTITPLETATPHPEFAIKPILVRGLPEPPARDLYALEDYLFSVPRPPDRPRGLWDYKYVPGLLSSADAQYRR